MVKDKINKLEARAIENIQTQAQTEKTEKWSKLIIIDLEYIHSHVI